MIYSAFRQALKGYPLISWPLIKMLTPGDSNLKVQLSRWRKKGKLLRLTKNFAVLNEADRAIFPSRPFLACELYKPSYISLEYALSFYGLIPARVADVTCITTKKTMTIINTFGTFIYRHCKIECFTGFTAQKDEAGLQFYLAEPEKALVDFIYLNLEKFSTGAVRDVLKNSYRFQGFKAIDRKKLFMFGAHFNNGKLLRILKEVKP
ncbi:MAG: hypothetical protein PHC61_00455 [Chitinivibrionales bacterium]|nr:hypothetical protein [Chitinivibrionales bacterium]